MNNVGVEVVFWTVLALYLLTKLGVFKKWKKLNGQHKFYFNQIDWQE